MTQSGGPLKGEQGERSRSPQSRLSVARRRAKVADLIAEGKSYRQAAGILGVSVATAYKDFQTVLAEQQPSTDLAEQRRLAVARLDHLEETLRQRLAEHQIQAYDAEGEQLNLTGNAEATALALLRVEERRAKLLGLDAPTQIKAEVQQVEVVVRGAENV